MDGEGIKKKVSDAIAHIESGGVNEMYLMPRNALSHYMVAIQMISELPDGQKPVGLLHITRLRVKEIKERYANETK